MCLRLFALLLCCTITSLAQSESPDYLDDALLPMPTNGSKVGTRQPLAPYSTYRIKITSPYNLKPVYSESQGNYETDIQIDGKTLRALSFDESSDGHISNLEFLYRGHGKPIYIGFIGNRYKEIETAQVYIYAEGWLEGIWRERFSGLWKSYGDMFVICLILIPIGFSVGVYLNKWNRQIKAEEKKVEEEREALIVNSHNKSLELMREIDRRAQQKAQEILTRNNDELQKKIVYWRTRAFTESYFLNAELRQNYAVANREKIINELEKEWAQEFLEIAQDMSLANALREEEPGVMHWIQARQEVVNIAHNLTWTTHPVIDAYFEEVPNAPQIIIADEMEEAEKGTKRRVRKNA